MVFVIELLFIVLLVIHNYAFAASIGKEEAIQSQIGLVLASHTSAHLAKPSAGQSSSVLELPSLQGPPVDWKYQTSHVERKGPVALPQLPQVEQAQYKLLWRLRWTLGGLYGPLICTTESTNAAASASIPCQLQQARGSEIATEKLCLVASGPTMEWGTVGHIWATFPIAQTSSVAQTEASEGQWERTAQDAQRSRERRPQGQTERRRQRQGQGQASLRAAPMVIDRWSSCDECDNDIHAEHSTLSTNESGS